MPRTQTPDAKSAAAEVTTAVEYDEFGLPIRRSCQIRYSEEAAESTGGHDGRDRANGENGAPTEDEKESNGIQKADPAVKGSVKEKEDGSSGGEDDFEDAVATPPPEEKPSAHDAVQDQKSSEKEQQKEPGQSKEKQGEAEPDTEPDAGATEKTSTKAKNTKPAPHVDATEKEPAKENGYQLEDIADNFEQTDLAAAERKRDSSHAAPPAPNGVSEFSHQQVTLKDKLDEEDDDGGWQTMPAFAPYDLYDDDNRLIAKEYNEEEDDEQTYNYGGVGGAGKGYTRVFVDDDAESATSMDENTQYLFKNAGGTSMMDDEDTRDAVSQMQATKDLLTEGQKIAYVGLTRIELSRMVKDVENIPVTRSSKKAIQTAAEAIKMWGQKIMIRLYTHMDISAAEQVMIEQLSEHGVMSDDLTPQLMANARVKNPLADRKSSISSSRPSSVASPRPPPAGFASPNRDSYDAPAEPPPAYDKHEGEELPAVRTPSQLPASDKLDIDIRWTILCDLFLVLIADSIYDARSRVLFERVGKALEINWLEICRFEKKVTEALEMQQQAERENWNEDEHKEERRKMALKKRYIAMGLATVGGGLVIGLSAGLLAPVIGAGLAAGFTTIGVTGTSSFLGGAAASAIITSGAAASGGVIGARAANRRTGAVKTFEYRPLHNNKRVNLIVTVSGWMTGKVDDVRLPFSTVDPVMGDIYSVLWEPEMLTSMGDTINILATEVRPG